MARTTLWLDNDPRYIEPYVHALSDHGYNVTVVTSVSEAERLINDEYYNLVIIDAMIPTRNADEEEVYPPEETERGLKMGVVFYKRVQETLKRKGMAVLVMTVRLDEAIHEQFKNAGLLDECFTTKLAVRRVSSFLEKVDALCKQTAAL